MSKSGGASSVSKGPRRRQSQRGHPKLDLLAQDDEPGGYHNPTEGEPVPSGAARRAGRKRLAVEDADGHLVKAGRADDYGALCERFMERFKAIAGNFDTAGSALAAGSVHGDAFAQMVKAINAEEPVAARRSVEELLGEYDVCVDLAIDASLQHDPILVRALEMTLLPHPKVMNGDNQTDESEALSKIITCASQKSRGWLVTELLRRGMRTWPAPGCVFDPTILPPLLAALKAYKTFTNKEEWQLMFEDLAQEGRMDAPWGPYRVTAFTEYYKLFKENHHSSE